MANAGHVRPPDALIDWAADDTARTLIRQR
jgi:hypothetical protein